MNENHDLVHFRPFIECEKYCIHHASVYAECMEHCSAESDGQDECVPRFSTKTFRSGFQRQEEIPSLRLQKFLESHPPTEQSRDLFEYEVHSMLLNILIAHPNRYFTSGALLQLIGIEHAIYVRNIVSSVMFGLQRDARFSKHIHYDLERGFMWLSEDDAKDASAAPDVRADTLHGDSTLHEYFRRRFIEVLSKINETYQYKKPQQ